jgi:hypothetical protein
MRTLTNNTRARHALIGTLLVVALGATGCAESKTQTSEHRSAKPAATSAPDVGAEYNMGVGGYPLDRTLDNLVKMRGVDTIVEIQGATVGEPTWIGRIGTKGGFPDAPGETIVGPVDATVSHVFRGNAADGDPIRTILIGGRIGDYEVHAEAEIAARPQDVAKYSRLLIAGQTTTSEDGFGQILDTWFLYGIDTDGHATSLMASASEKEPEFSMAQLGDALGNTELTH